MNNSTNISNTDTHRKRLDILPKILCFVAAFILWLYVTQVETYEYEETFKQVPVEIVNAQSLKATSGLHVYSGYDNTVNVTVLGRRSDINKYTSQNIRVTADVSGITEPGVHSVQIIAEPPSGLSISSMSLSHINVDVDVEITREIDIICNKITGSVSSKYEMQTNPSHTLVTITGPKALVNSIDHAQYSLDIGELSSTKSFMIPLELVSNGEIVDTQRGNIIMGREVIEVVVTLFEQKEVPFSIDFEHGYYNDENVKLTFKPETILIKGDPDELRNIESLSLGPIDEKEIVNDCTKMFIPRLPEGITSVNLVNSVEVKITHIDTEVRTFTVDNIKLTGIKNRTCTLQTESLDVKIRGTKEELDRISEDNLKITVDLSAYESLSGTVNCAPSVNIVGVSVNDSYIVGKYNVEVTIE